MGRWRRTKVKGGKGSSKQIKTRQPHLSPASRPACAEPAVQQEAPELVCRPGVQLLRAPIMQWPRAPALCQHQSSRQYDSEQTTMITVLLQEINMMLW